jgi:hypothetical protein
MPGLEGEMLRKSGGGRRKGEAEAEEKTGGPRN